MSRLRLIVLGSAAGGGVPQWNCRCPVCAAAWEGRGTKPRTQTSVAISANGDDWVLLDCAPEILSQIVATPALHPRHGPRDSPICGVLLTGGDVDHIAGLLGLRERQPFSLYATPQIHALLRANQIFDVLAPDVVERREIMLGDYVGLAPGIRAKIFPVPGKKPLYQEGANVEVGLEGEANIGVEIRVDGRVFFYIPGCAFMTEALRSTVYNADVVLFDGTLWHDEEMQMLGTGTKTGRRMAHMAMSGSLGSLAAFADLAIRRKIFIHINNTNPVLLENSPERQWAEAAGWEIAYDGMEIAL